MRINKKKLLDIFLKDLESNCPESPFDEFGIQRNGWTHVDKYLTEKGYHGERAVRIKSERNSVKLRLFSFLSFQGGDSYWVRIPRDLAEKILFFGAVPEVNEPTPTAEK